MSLKQINKILIANRGEIALRIARTCQKMGIETAVVYSDVDRDSKFVRESDEAMGIGGISALESYLNIPKIIQAAHDCGAQAIHPGYGFLSENATFAEAVQEARLIFIGPHSETIRTMGLKNLAKDIARKAGVPVIPGYGGEDQSLTTLMAQAKAVGFPCMIKAAAGGGGKGMRLVFDENHLESAIQSAKREAQSAFKNGALIIEKYIESPRHIEVQIFADEHGHVIHLLERECSLQRRHQKVIEESPSPVVTPKLRKKICEAAIKVARAVQYTGAGTVEFVLSPQGRFYFLEMNTRLQVEHPVTEMITGLDLVKMQIEVAQGLPLALTQKDILPQGHAIEARLYAEDPEQQFLPMTGRLLRFELPCQKNIRYEIGVDEHDEISMHYDPMIGKIIATAKDRAECLQSLITALTRITLLGTKTNLPFLIKLLKHPAVQTANFHVGFIEGCLSELLSTRLSLPQKYLIAAVFCLATNDTSEQQRSKELSGFRNTPQGITFHLCCQDIEYVIFCQKIGPHLFEVTLNQERCTVFLNHLSTSEVVITINQHRERLHYCLDKNVVYFKDKNGPITITQSILDYDHAHALHHPGDHAAPLPGKVLKITVSPGQPIQKGDILMVIEAMKMEHSVKANATGHVKKIFFKENDVVQLGDVLVEIEGETHPSTQL